MPVLDAGKVLHFKSFTLENQALGFQYLIAFLTYNNEALPILIFRFFAINLSENYGKNR